MRRYVELLKEYGYEFAGGVLIEKGIRGYTRDRVVGRFRDAMDAAEYLCPFVRDDEFTNRLICVD